MTSCALKEIDIRRLHSSALHRLKDYFREALKGSYDSSYEQAIADIDAELQQPYRTAQRQKVNHGKA